MLKQDLQTEKTRNARRNSAPGSGKEGKDMAYKSIDELDARIESIVRKTVESYYTDWKNYDRPKYMRLKGSKNRDDKIFYLIVRSCGTWIVTKNEYMTSESMKTVFDYYWDQERSTYYKVNIDRLEIKKCTDPDKERKDLEKERLYKAA